MGKIIKAEFKKKEQKSIEDMTREELLQSYEDMTVASHKMHGMKVELLATPRGDYGISLTNISPIQSVVCTVGDIDKTTKIYLELQTHVIAGDRTFDELVMMLNGKIES